jgi:acyl-CoA synthetase (AMP-forming)/AMP-acid ligase II
VLLQYTSGSLGDPKAIELCTRSIFSNLGAIGDAFGMREGDIGFSWLPLYHDMGLHSVFFDLMFQMPLVVMAPTEFLWRPSAWLQAISKYKVTHSPAPSFGYAFASRRIKDSELGGVDLSTWRVAMCGAEPIDADALNRFADRFAARGFQRSAYMGAYGLAENTVAVSFAAPQTGMRIDRLDSDVLAAQGVARIAGEGQRAQQVVSVGAPILGHDVRILAPDGREQPDGTQGEIQVRGPSRMLGYRGDPDTTARSFEGEWLRTGDLGYTRDGELYITGRSKDLIIRGGKNYYPQDIEAAAVVDGIRAGAIAAFGRRDPLKGTEDIVVVAEVRREENLRQPHLADDVRKAIHDRTGLSVNQVVLVKPGAVPKTTSGKLRRGEAKARFEADRLQPPPAPNLVLLARVGVWNLLPVTVQKVWTGLGRLRARLSRSRRGNG